MPENDPIDEHIPRDPGRDDPESLSAPNELESDDSLHSTHSHSKASTESSSKRNTDNSQSKNIPRCAMCGYDRTGLEAKEVCPECGKYQNAPHCTFCNYELSGLLVTQNCPECGKPIWDSNIQPPTSGMAIASMVVGIVSLVSCIFYGLPALVLGPIAIIFGEIANRQFKNGTRAGNTKGFALTGRICGWAGFAIGATIVVLFIFVIFNM